MIGENSAPRDGWAKQPGRHCGEICIDLVCPTCGEPPLPMPAHPIPANIELGGWGE